MFSVHTHFASSTQVQTFETLCSHLNLLQFVIVSHPRGTIQIDMILQHQLSSTAVGVRNKAPLISSLGILSDHVSRSRGRALTALPSTHVHTADNRITLTC